MSSLKVLKGFGLVEILVSLLIGALILTTLLNYFIQSKSQYLKNQAQIDYQLDILWLSQLLENSLQLAGFTPCAKLSELITLDRRVPQKRSLRAIRYEDQRSIKLILARMSEDFGQLYGFNGLTQLEVSRESNLKSAKAVIVADCWHAEVQRVEQVKTLAGKQIVTLSQPLAFSYQAPGYVGEWIEESWESRSGAKHETVLYYSKDESELLSSTVHYFEFQQQKDLLLFSLGESLENSIETRVWLRN